MRIAVLGALMVATPVFAAGVTSRAPELAALNVQSGHWVYHGTTAPTKSGGKPGLFTWNEHCLWSADQLFLLCTFHNVWSGHKVQSLVVDTWNTHDRTYWHYEMFATGAPGRKPYATKMTIHGNTWVESATTHKQGQDRYERIRYVYRSPTRVAVTIATSADRKHWSTLVSGTGRKIP
ncbi:MAG: hypothetical protein ACP5P4_01095 [Steroidobacteraceae bacterium]